MVRRPRSGIVERLVRLGRSIPPGVQLGYHFCHGHEAHHRDRPYHAQPLVDVANALSLSLSRSLDWLHLPVAGDRVDLRFFETLAQLALRPETRLYLGLLHPSDGELGARARIVAAQRFVHDFGVATDCGWARHRPQDVAPLIELHRAVSAPIQPARGGPAPSHGRPAGSGCPTTTGRTSRSTRFGEAYDNVDHHSWYRNLDATVEELSHLLNDGDILVDYSGGTGILLDRLKLRMFDVRAGAVIVDSSPKFLRVALEKFRDDPDVGLRLLRFLKPEKRLQRLDEVLGPELLERRVDAIVSTNAIHLYPDLADTVASWMRALRPGGHVLINSGNIRNLRLAATSGSSTRPCGWSATSPRGSCATIRRTRATAPTSTTRNAWRPTPPTATACSSSPARWTSTSRPSSSRASRSSRCGRRASRRGSTTGTSCSARTTTRCSAGSGAPRRSTVRRRRPRRSPTGRLIRHAMDVLFHGRPKFQACWTYITCVN